MASPNNHVSFMDHTAFSISLIVKLNRNMIVDLDASKCSNVIQPLIECLNQFFLKNALVYHEEVPLYALILAYSIKNYNKSKDVMSFEIHEHKMSIIKANFIKFLGLSTRDSYPNLIWFYLPTCLGFIIKFVTVQFYLLYPCSKSCVY